MDTSKIINDLEKLTLVKQLAIKERTMWPALMFAINRTVRVNGRIKIDTVSIKIKKEIKAAGAPLGAKCAALSFGLKIIPEIRIKPQSVRAIVLANHKDLEGLYTNGVNPDKLIKIIKNINENKSKGRPSNDLFPWINLFKLWMLLLILKLNVFWENITITIIVGTHEKIL